MSRLALAAAGLVVALSAGDARAQQPFGGPQSSPYGRPVVSPYLNLARGGNAGINYYGLVRPQVEAREAFERLSLASPQPPAGADPQQPLLQTGYKASFGTYQSYFGSVQPVLVPSPVMKPLATAQGGAQSFGRAAGPRR